MPATAQSLGCRPREGIPPDSDRLRHKRHCGQLPGPRPPPSRPPAAPSPSIPFPEPIRPPREDPETAARTEGATPRGRRSGAARPDHIEDPRRHHPAHRRRGHHRATRPGSHRRPHQGELPRDAAGGLHRCGIRRTTEHVLRRLSRPAGQEGPRHPAPHRTASRPPNSSSGRAAP